MTVAPATGVSGSPEGRAGALAAISLHGASVARAGREVWSGVDLEIAAGEFVAVLGPNGVGKSTLLNVVLGLLPLAAGTARIFGVPPGQANARIGYVPQRRSFEPSLPVRGIDVVRLGLDGNRWGVPLWWRRRADDERVSEVVELVGASAYASEPIGALSGGEQQRLLIAQALAPRPDLLLLDEPLDSLDPSNQQAVTALLGAICRGGVTVVIVAHDVNPVLPYVDQVVYLARGGVVSGRPADVITSERLSALYDAPIEVLRASDGRLVVVGQPEPPAHHTDRHAG